MSSKKQLLAQFNLLNHWFNNSLEDLSDSETNQRIDQQMNHIKYLAGHLVNAQYGIADLSGAKIQHKWNDLFAGLSKTKALDNFNYPSIEEIKKEWNDMFPIVKEKLKMLPDEELDREIPGSSLKGSGIFDGTVGDLWAFLNEHQMYHIGQIGILRRALGKAPMKLF
jgi:uncharacterized damage-inducible protein DinB